MKIANIILGIMIIVFAFPAKGVCADDQCRICHESLEDAPSALFKHDIHASKGVSCADCHGGNSTTDDMDVAMDPKNGFLGVPKGNDISKTCAKCHSDEKKLKSFGANIPTGQWEMLQSSVHGELSTSGKSNIVQCITCHNAHGIVSVKNPASPVYPLNVVKTCTNCHANASYMRNYNPSLPVDQLAKYKTSVHGMRNATGDPKPAECASCHGSHDIRAPKDIKSSIYPVNLPLTCSKCHSDVEYMKQYKIPTDQYEKYSTSVHGIALLQKHDAGAPACNSCHGNHGAAPPGLESVSKVCGTCHALNADLFSSSPHKKAFDDRKLPECETCHGNHAIVAATDSLLGVSSGALCARCHHEQDPDSGFVIARSMRTAMDSLDFSERHAAAMVAEAEQKGMEISEAKFKLRDIRQARLESRTMVHSFNEQKFLGVIDKGLSVAKVVEGEADDAISEYYFRRYGLGVSTFIITILSISLYLFIRKIEKTK